MHLVKNIILETLLVSLALITLTSGSNLAKRDVDNQKKVVCYYANWAVYRQGVAKFSPQNINPYLCTHLIYAFGGLQKDDSIAPFDKYQDLEKSGFSRFAALKTYNKELKTMLAIGGWNEASKKFSPMVADPQRRNTFIKSAIRFLRQYNFDGIDLDWEYPTQRKGGRPQDKENYAKLINEMREVFEREAEQTGKDRLIISMAVPASLEITAEGYDVRSLNKDLDFFNILAYDYHSSFEPAVNHHSPLFRIKDISEFDFRADLNIESTIKYYIGHGASPEKLVLGIPMYGRSYTLVNPDAHAIGSPTDGPGVQGNGTKEDGYLAYYEICNGIKDEKWEVVDDYPRQVGPYAHHDNFWVGYDDINMVSEKAYYVAEEGLGGIMFWTIDNDDFRGTCHNEPYPLIEAAKRALYSSSKSVQSSKSGRNKITTPVPPTTPSSEPGFVCTDEGFFPHSKSCKKYYWCLEAAGVGMVAHTFTCPQGLFFNSLTDGCDFKRNVECGDKSQHEEIQVQSTTTEKNKEPDTNEKSVEDILQEIKSAGGLEAFEEKRKEEELEKKELKERTKERNNDISSKTRNRFSQLLRRKKPKESESSSPSNDSEDPKRSGSFLSRLANRRRNSTPNRTSPTIEETSSTTPLPPSSTSSTTSPSRSGFIRNRNRPSFLRNKPASSPQEESVSDEENEINPPETLGNTLARDRFRNSERTSFLNRGTPPSISEEKTGLGDAEPVKISSDSFRSKSKTVRKNFGRQNEEDAFTPDEQTPELITEGTPSLRSRNTESRNLAYVTIDRSRGRAKLSDDTVPVLPSQDRTTASSPEVSTSKGRNSTVRDLEYVTIQRGVPSRNKLLSKVTANPRSISPSTNDPVTAENDGNTTDNPTENVAETTENVSSVLTTVTIKPEITSSTTSDPITTTILNQNIFDEENILNISVFKTISETLRIPLISIFRPQSSEVSSVSIEKTTIPEPEKTTTIPEPEKTTTTVELHDSTITTTIIPTTISTTTLSTTTTINKIQALINQRKQSGNNKFLLIKARKDLEAVNEINDSKSTSSTPIISPFKRQSGLRGKFPRRTLGKKVQTTTTTTTSSSSEFSTDLTTATTLTTTERNGFVKPSRPTNRLFNKFISRGTIGKLTIDDKSTSTTLSSTTVSKPLTPVTRSTLRSFIPTRPFAFRPSVGFKPIDLSAAPSKKSISQDRSSLRKNSLFSKETDSEIFTTSKSPVVDATTEKLTVGKILANLHGESTEKPESLTLRPKSFKPKFARNKLRENLRHQLEEEKEINIPPTEDSETTTPVPKTNKPGIRIKDKITPRRILPRLGSNLSKLPRTLNTISPRPSTPSRFQPTPRRNLRNRFSPTSIGFSRNKAASSALPSLISKTTQVPTTVSKHETKILSNDDIAQKLGLIPTPIPLVALEDESVNVIESTTLPSSSNEDLLAGLVNSHSENESTTSVSTEKYSVESLLKSAVVSSAVPKTSGLNSNKNIANFFPKPLPPLSPTLSSSNEDQDGNIENNFVRPHSSSPLTSRRQNLRKRGRKIKRRRGQSRTPSTESSLESFTKDTPSLSPTVIPKRQFSRRPINFSRQRNRSNVVKTTTITPVVEDEDLSQDNENQVAQNEIESKFRRRRPNFSRRRNLGKLSIKNITDTGRDSDLDLDNINKTIGFEENIILTEEISSKKTQIIENNADLDIVNTESSIKETETTTKSDDDTTLSSKRSKLLSQREKPSKSFFNRGRKPSKFSGFRRGPPKEDSEEELSLLTTLGYDVTETPVPNTIETTLFDGSRIERRSTLSSIINDVQLSTESYFSPVSEFNFSADEAPPTTAQPFISAKKKSPIFRKNRPSFFKTQLDPIKAPRRLSYVGNDRDAEIAIKKAVDSITSSPSVYSRTTTEKSVSSAPHFQVSSTPRSLFNNALKRSKFPFFRRKNSISKAKEIESTDITTKPFSSSSSTASAIIDRLASNTSTTIIPSTSKPSSLKDSKIRPPNFKLKNSQIIETSSPVDETSENSSLLDNSIDIELKVNKIQTNSEEVKPQAQNEDESAEDVESLEGRLRQRLQERKIKKTQNRNSLFKNSRRPSFIRTSKPVASTEPSVFVPTIPNTRTENEGEELDETFIQVDEHSFKTNTISSTTLETDSPTTQTTARQRFRPILSTTSPPPQFQKDNLPFTPSSTPSSRDRFRVRDKSISTLPSPVSNRFRPQISSSFQSNLSESQEQSSEPITSFQRNPIIPQVTSSEPITSSTRDPITPQVTSSNPTPFPSQRPLQSSTFPTRNRFKFRNPTSQPIPSRSTNPSTDFVNSTSEPSQKNREQPRRLNVFRNRFQVSPSSPSPIISKSNEEELFSKIQRQNQLPTNKEEDTQREITDIPRVTISITTTTHSRPSSTTRVQHFPSSTTRVQHFPSSSPTPSRTGVSRLRNKSVNRPLNRPLNRPRTTTPAPPIYEYYYDEYPEDDNGIGNLKSVDPVYDYDLTTLKNKVKITSEGIECYDVGVFPHPGSCKKFITCSRRTSRGRIDGWEYECPLHLAFDPIGGRCNWAAEVDCS